MPRARTLTIGFSETFRGELYDSINQKIAESRASMLILVTVSRLIKASFTLYKASDRSVILYHKARIFI